MELPNKNGTNKLPEAIGTNKLPERQINGSSYPSDCDLFEKKLVAGSVLADYTNAPDENGL